MCVKSRTEGGKMLLVNKCNYSPNFGKLYCTKTPETRAVLQKCSQETLDAIVSAGNMLESTKFLDGIIKKIGDKLVFRVFVPEGFEFPVGSFYKKQIQLLKNNSSQYGRYEDKALKFANLQKNGDTITAHTSDYLKLQKVNSENGRIEYEVKSSADTIYDLTKNELENESGSLNIQTLARKLKSLDYDIGEIAGGRLKPKTAEQSDTNNELKRQTLDYILNKF